MLSADCIRKESRLQIAIVRCVKKGEQVMIKIENFEVMGWDHVIRGMRNPMNSWDKSDSGICKGGEDGIGCENCAVEIPCTHS